MAKQPILSRNTNPNLNPILPIQGVPDQLIQTLNDRFREIRLAPASTPASSAGTAAAAGVDWRTLLIRNCTVANDVADHLPCMGTSPTHQIVLVRGVLGRTISSTLTVRINSTIAGVTSVIGSFSLPSTTPLDTDVDFTSFTTASVADGSVFTFDITAGDGSTSSAGVATFTIVFKE